MVMTLFSTAVLLVDALIKILDQKTSHTQYPLFFDQTRSVPTLSKLRVFTVIFIIWCWVNRNFPYFKHRLLNLSPCY